MTQLENVYPLDRFGLIRREAALAAGFTDNELAKLVRTGELIRLVCGSYAVQRSVDSTDPSAVAERAEEVLRLRSIALVTGAKSGGASVLSHQSAAVMHGLPLLKVPLDLVHLVNGEIGGGQRRRLAHVHAAAVPDGDLVEVDGIAVTSLERTAADVAQSFRSDHTLAFAQALVVLDGALRLGADPEALALQLQGRRRCGTRVAKHALEYADGLAESAGESWGRAQMIVAGLPLPRLQVKHTVGSRRRRLEGTPRVGVRRHEQVREIPKGR